MRSWLVALALLRAAPLLAQEAVRTAAPPFAFVDVTVVPMDRERLLPNQTVVIADGIIVKIGPTSAVAIPPNAVVIDGRRRFLAPGLTDAHVHLATDMPWAPTRDDFGDGPLYLASGVTAVINLGGSSVQLDWRRRVAAGELVGPTIYTSGEFINEPKMATPDEVQRAVEAQFRDGYDLIKFRERPQTTVGLSLPAYTRLIETSERLGLPLVGHAPVNLGLDRMLEARQSLAHVNMFSNIYFLPLAVHPNLLLASAIGVVVLLAVAIGDVFAWWRKRADPAATIARRRSALLSSLASALVTIIAFCLVFVLPGGPLVGDLWPRIVASISAAVLGLMFLAFVYRLILRGDRRRSLLPAVGSGLLVWLLGTFWLPVVWRSTPHGVARVAARAHDAGISVVSTLIVYEAIAADQRARLIDDPAIDYLMPRTRSLWRGLPRSGPPGYSLPTFTRSLIRGLRDADVQILAGTDAMGVELVVPGISLIRELELLHESGLTPFEAMRAATVAPAAFLRKTSEFGTIEEGKRADLVLLDENPLEEIRRIAAPAGVMARGRWYDRAALDRMLAALRAERD